jgi:hypothetical protein
MFSGIHCQMQVIEDTDGLMWCTPHSAARAAALSQLQQGEFVTARDSGCCHTGSTLPLPVSKLNACTRTVHRVGPPLGGSCCRTSVGELLSACAVTGA